MNFILPFSVEKLPQQISIKPPILFAGSCFAEEMAHKMQERQFNITCNPHGILYNPISISTAIKEYLQKKIYTEKDCFLYNELWHSYHHHGSYSHPEIETCLRQINNSIGHAHAQLMQAKWLAITFGSAFAYMENTGNEFVANCHKVPGTRFTKVLLNRQQILDEWNHLIQELKSFNPSLNILFTVSPVKYIRDGIVENNRSKAILIDSVHTLTEQNANCFYFPAYEIVTDELRDYRFYKEDLVHPNGIAINYVWEKFVQTALDEYTQQFIADYEPYLKNKQHRSLQSSTNASERFRLYIQQQETELKSKYPFL